jgi:dihydrofolate reductase
VLCAQEETSKLYYGGKMRKITFGGANSLDNYIAREDHSFDWILPNDELGSFMGDYWQKIDTILMGRKTYDVAIKQRGSANSPGMNTYVFSNTLDPSSSKDDVVIIDGDAADFVKTLKEKEGKDVCLMGGGELAKSLFEAKLIDEVGVNIHRVLLGSGIPLFHKMAFEINLELKDCKWFKNSCVLLTYNIKY